jgi:hypothetical protein
MEGNVLEEFNGFTLNYEENLFGGIGNWCFLRICSVVHVEVVRRGAVVVFLLCVWRNFCIK